MAKTTRVLTPARAHAVVGPGHAAPGAHHTRAGSNRGAGRPDWAAQAARAADLITAAAAGRLTADTVTALGQAMAVSITDTAGGPAGTRPRPTR